MSKFDKLEFSINQDIVYPKHGVGTITDIRVQEISGITLELYVVRFEKERMTLRVPTEKAVGVGMRCITQLAEVVRDLHRSGDQSEQSYSERQIYESAISRLAREVAAVEETCEKEALSKLETILTPEKIEPEVSPEVSPEIEA